MTVPEEPSLLSACSQKTADVGIFNTKERYQVPRDRSVLRAAGMWKKAMFLNHLSLVGSPFEGRGDHEGQRPIQVFRALVADFRANSFICLVRAASLRVSVAAPESTTSSSPPTPTTLHLHRSSSIHPQAL